MDRDSRFCFWSVIVGLMLLARPVGAQSGWFWQNPLPQGNQLMATAMVNANTVYAVGFAGTILRSDDGGLTWTIQNSGTKRYLVGISCTDANTCTAVGQDDDGTLGGPILRTTDGGVTWIPQSTGVTLGNFTGVSCTDANTCSVTGGAAGSPVILRTTDGGATWVRQSSPSAFLHAISCVNVNTCTAIGSKILRTTNGGATWTVQFDVPPEDALEGVFCTDADTCTAVGSGVSGGLILRTTDGGVTWMQQSNPDDQGLWSVHCPDSTTCIAVGWHGIIRTTNGGTIWTRQSSGTDMPLFGVAFTDASNGLAVGRGGTTLRTTDGGATWTIIPRQSVTYDSLYGISCPDANICTAVGGDQFGFPRSTIVHTTNGGANWITQSSGTTNKLRGVTCPDPNTCIAVGDQGTIVRTTNGGANWITQSSGTTDRLNGVSCPDANTCIAVGGRDDATSPWGTLATILRTSDGGATWVRQDPSLPDDPIAELRGVSFTDVNTGTAVGAHFAIVRTVDGAYWNDESPGTTPTLWSVSMTDTDTGMAAADSNIFRANPLGTLWTPVFGEGARGISCTDANASIAVGFNRVGFGDYSTIVRTTDGGSSWTHQSSPPFGRLNAVSCAGANTCTAVGEGGTILRTNTGGQ